MPPKKIKITLDVLGKKMQYEGAEEHKERDLFKLMDKMGVSDVDAVPVYRKNLPEASATDPEIHQRRADARKARDEKKKKGDTAEAPSQDSAPPPVQQPATAQQPQVEQQQVQQPPVDDRQSAMDHQQQQDMMANGGGGGEFTADYQNTLDDFIGQIVRTERPTLQERISGGAAAAQPQAQPQVQQLQQQQVLVPAPIHNRRASLLDDDEVQQIKSTGKVSVYLSLEGADSNKMISVPVNTTFDEYKSLVHKKFGHSVVMHFRDGDDLIDLDDDDTLCIFFEISAGRKLKVYCKQPPLVVDDAMTMKAASGEGAVTQEGKGRTSTGSEKADIKGDVDGPAKADISTSVTFTYTGHTGAIYCCGFAPNMDRFISASRDKSVRLWNLADGSCTQMKGGHSEMVLSADFSQDAEHVVSSSVDPTIKLWKASTGSKFQTLKGHTDKVYCTRFNDTGKYIASASCDRSVRVWSAVRGNQLAKLEGHTLMVFSCDFSQTDNGKLLASASEDRLVKIWDWEQQKETVSLLSHTGPVWSCRFSKDDKYMVSASMDNEVKIWDLKMNKPLRTFKGHRVPVHDALFTPDGKWVFSCGRDNKILKWSTQVGESADSPIQVAEEFTGHTDIIYHIDYCEKGGKGQLLSCSLDQTVKLWTPTSK